MSTLGGVPVVMVNVQVPPSGAWFGTVVLNATELPALGRTSLVLADLVLVGEVVRVDWDDAPNGARPIATLRGGAGWGRPLLRDGVAIEGSYSSGGGVKLSTVLQDLATMTGETIGAISDDVSLGDRYGWPAHTTRAPFFADRVLLDLVARGFLPTWRIEPFSGNTVFTSWPAIGLADGRGRVVNRARDRGRRTVGLDVQAAAFLPGATLEGVRIARTVYRGSASELAAEVYDA